MRFKKYRKEIFRPQCNPHCQSLHCIVHLDRLGEAELYKHLDYYQKIP